MKTIVENSTNLSKYIFADDASVTMSSEKIITPNFIIADLNSGNSSMIENVTPPENWSGDRYTFDGSTWTANPDWVDPTLVEGDD
jgi:hypothetical protein